MCHNFYYANLKIGYVQSTYKINHDFSFSVDIFIV